MLLNQKDWSCPRKKQARQETIIEKYQQNFHKIIPKHKQYWTICGQCATPTGSPLAGSEPAQMIEKRLIYPEQFFGVEINQDIHNLNTKAMPELNFINNDFYRAMLTAKSKLNFNPGIVNADLPRTPDIGASYIGRLMAFLTDTANDLLFVANFILRMKYYSAKDGDYVLNSLNKNSNFRYAMTNANWDMEDYYCEYPGTGNTGSRTYMGTFMFIKK